MKNYEAPEITVIPTCGDVITLSLGTQSPYEKTGDGIWEW